MDGRALHFVYLRPHRSPPLMQGEFPDGCRVHTGEWVFFNIPVGGLVPVSPFFGGHFRGPSRPLLPAPSRPTTAFPASPHSGAENPARVDLVSQVVRNKFTGMSQGYGFLEFVSAQVVGVGQEHVAFGGPLPAPPSPSRPHGPTRARRGARPPAASCRPGTPGRARPSPLPPRRQRTRSCTRTWGA